MDINAKLAEVAVEFRDIENGHLVSNYIGYETLIFPMALFYGINLCRHRNTTRRHSKAYLSDAALEQRSSCAYWRILMP